MICNPSAKEKTNTSFIFRISNNRMPFIFYFFFSGKERGLVGILAFAKSYRILASFTFTVRKGRNYKGRKYSLSGTFFANSERKKLNMPL